MPPALLARVIPALVAVVAVGLSAALAYSWAYGRGGSAERARAEEATREAAARFAAALAEQQETIGRLDRELVAARRRTERRREELADAITTDASSRDWARNPIPLRVRDALADRRDLPSDPGVFNSAVLPAGPRARD